MEPGAQQRFTVTKVIAALDYSQAKHMTYLSEKIQTRTMHLQTQLSHPILCDQGEI